MHRRVRVPVSCVAGILLVGCTSGGTDPEPNPGGNPGGNPPLPQNATVRLEIRGLTGAEGAMEVRYAIASGPVTRAAESVIPRAALLQYCTTVGSSGSCDITVPVGQFVSLYAYEGYAGTHYTTPNPIALPKEAHEFVAFSGDCSQSGGLLQGDCGVNVTQAKTYNVRADFTSMPEYRIMMHGATAFDITITVRNMLVMPIVNRSPTPGGSGGLVGTPTLNSQGWYPFGTEVKLVAKPNNQGQFIRWEGCKTGTGGTNPTCIVAQSTSGGTPATVRIFSQYWQCPVGVADGPSPNCMLVRP